MSKDRIIIVGFGDLEEEMLSNLSKRAYIIAADAAAYWLLKKRIVPDEAVGDFDSLNKEEFEKVKKRVKRIIVHKVEKDFTDMELALRRALELRPREIIVYGAIGSRMDHTFGNIQLLEQARKEGINAKIRNKNNELSLVNKKAVLTASHHFQYFSLLSVPETSIVSITGAKYSREHMKIHRGQTIGISNEITHKVCTITVHNGLILLIRCKD